MPASRRAAATTLAPRSWPSRPGFATSTRIGRERCRGFGSALIIDSASGSGTGLQGELAATDEQVDQLGDTGRRGHMVSGVTALGIHQGGVETGGLRPDNVRLVDVADVEYLVGTEAECLDRERKDTGIRLLHAREIGVHHHI